MHEEISHLEGIRQHTFGRNCSLGTRDNGAKTKRSCNDHCILKILFKKIKKGIVVGKGKDNSRMNCRLKKEQKYKTFGNEERSHKKPKPTRDL